MSKSVTPPLGSQICQDVYQTSIADMRIPVFMQMLSGQTATPLLELWPVPAVQTAAQQGSV